MTFVVSRPVDVGERVDPGGDVVQGRRNPAAAADSAVLEVPGGPAPRGETGGEWSAERQVVRRLPETAMDDHHHPALLPVRPVELGELAGVVAVGNGLAHDQASAAGSVAAQAARTSASGTVNRPSTEMSAPPVRPIGDIGTPCSCARPTSGSARSSGTVTIARAADSEKRPTNASSASATVAPMLFLSADSTSACARPPSERSWALVIVPTAAPRNSASARSAARSTLGGRPPRWPWTTCAHSEPESSSRVSPRERSAHPRRRRRTAYVG